MLGKIGSFLKNRVLLPIYDGTKGAVTGAFRGVYNSVTSSVKNMVDTAVDTVTGFPESVVNSIKDLDDRLLGIPIGPGFTIGDFGKIFTEPSWGGANEALAAITGVNLQQTFSQFASPSSVEARIETFMGAIGDMVANEMKACIERCLQKILGKVPELGWLLSWQSKLGAYITEIRNKIHQQIQRQLERYLYDKLKLQQLAQLKMKILEGVRRMCPCDGEVPPSTVRRLQNDLTWSIVDGNRSLLEVARETSPEMSYYAENPNSTGRQMEGIIRDVLDDIRKESKKQMLGFTDDTVSTYVNDDGSLVADDRLKILPGTPTNTPITLTITNE